MSQPSNVHPDGGTCSNALPAWVSSGVLGLVIGAGGTLLAMQYLNPPVPKASGTANASSPPASMPGMGGGGMGMGGGGMGGPGGGGGGKRALTMLVGKLDLLSRADIKLHIELDAEQAKSIAAKLTEFEQSKTMTADEAQANLDALEALLSNEQKDVLAAIGLPGGRGGRGGGSGGGGGAPGGPGGGVPGGPPPGGGAMAGGMGGGMMGGGNTDPNANPFTQEPNQKRLRDLLDRLGAGSNDAPEK